MKERLEQAVDGNENPAVIIYELLQQNPNLALQIFKQYGSALNVLTTPEGRKYLETTLPNLLDYLEELTGEKTENEEQSRET